MIPGGFSRKLCNEITKNSRCYFVENGIRKSLIRNFNQLDLFSNAVKLF
jgi:hypothetical protein